MTDYTKLIEMFSPLLEETYYKISILANSSALLYEYLEQINWVGFYLNKKNKLLLGPFQGKVACTEIPYTKGVCGACATSKETILVPNVYNFKGHIACDSTSKSEICIPIIVHKNLFAILDIDSPILNRFTENDKMQLEKIAKIISTHIERIDDEI